MTAGGYSTHTGYSFKYNPSFVVRPLMSYDGEIKKKVTTKTENKLLSRIPLHTDGGVTVYDVRHTLPEVPGINGRGTYKKKV